MPPEPTFFPIEADFRRWLPANHETAPELLVGFWKKSSGKRPIDWPQARGKTRQALAARMEIRPHPQGQPDVARFG